MLKLGSKVKYAGLWYRVGAVAWLGERYYFLVRRGEVAMIPAATLESAKEPS